MNLAHQQALITALSQYAPLTALVGEVITWDALEDDLVYPSVTLRLLGTRMPARHLKGRGGIFSGQIEIAAHETTMLASGQLLDKVIEALNPFEEGPTQVDSVTFGGVHLDDVTQSSASARGRYRKAARFIVHAYE